MLGILHENHVLKPNVMKRNLLLLWVVIAASLASCTDDNDDVPQGKYLIATPLTTNLAEFKEAAIDVMEPVPIENSGKIYAYKNLVFVNDVGRGFHVIDNGDPTAPENISFIKLEGNYDISIKDDRLYADSYGDLIVLDISDIYDIKMIKRMEDAIYQEFWCTVSFAVDWPQADYYDYSDFDANTEAIIGWEVKTEKLSQAEFESRFAGSDLLYSNAEFDSGVGALSTSDPSTIGQGGSLARFKIVANYLYAVEWSSISIFDISDLNSPKVLEDVYANGTIETIYNQGDILFVGGTQGMYIYDISSPDKPTFISEFVHGTACDPVVVDGNYAFVTLRGENSCGGTESGLYIVDVTDLKNPELKKFYSLTNPYGLGFKGDNLFICDGSDGLKVYDKSNVEDLKLVNHFKDIVTYDVIPLEHSLLMIGDKVLYQYEYLDNDIHLLSAFELR